MVADTNLIPPVPVKQNGAIPISSGSLQQLTDKAFSDLHPASFCKSPQPELQTIFACELGFIDDTHVPFNAGFLSTVRLACPKARLCFFGSRKHIEALKKEIGGSLAASISWREIHPCAPGTSYSARLIQEFRMLRRILREFPGKSASRLLLTSAYPATIVALKLLKRLRFRSANIQVMLHGNLSGVAGRRRRHPVRRFQDMKTALTLLQDTNIRYLVLEKAVCRAVLQNIPRLAGKIESFDHPLTATVENSAIDLDYPVRFGFLGFATRAKGFGVFLQLAAAMKAKYRNRVEFHAIGNVSLGDGSGFELGSLDTKPGIAPISRPEFLRMLSKSIISSCLIWPGNMSSPAVGLCWMPLPAANRFWPGKSPFSLRCLSSTGILGACSGMTRH
jgi:hypothetical protein